MTVSTAQEQVFKRSAVPAGYYRSAICGGMLLRKRSTTPQPTNAVLEKDRTPTEHRAVLDAWRAKAAKLDHEIFGRKLKTDKPRHRDLAALGALRRAAQARC